MRDLLITTSAYQTKRWHIHGHTIRLEDSQDLVSCTSSMLWFQSYIVHKLTSNDFDLGNAVRVPQKNANLWWSLTFLSKLANLLNDLFGCCFQPCWRSSTIWNGRGRNALAMTVHATHIGGGLLKFRWLKSLSCHSVHTSLAKRNNPWSGLGNQLFLSATTLSSLYCLKKKYIFRAQSINLNFQWSWDCL